jgi:hypothetical protein
MGEKDFNAHVLSDDTKNKLATYHKSNAELQDALQDFFDNNSDELAVIDRLREDRNEALDTFKKALRAEAGEQDITEIQAIVVDEFKVQKKWSSWYVVEQFVELAQGCGMYDSAVAEGVIQEKTEVNGKLAEEWLRKNSLTEQFELSLDGKELTPAVTGPKEMPPLGSEKK